MKPSHILAAALLVAIAGVLLSGNQGCTGTKYQFFVGQRVLHALDGREGIVLDKNWYDGGIRYNVRFVCDQQTTDTGIISSDGPIKNAPYAEILCYEHELRAKR